MKPLKMTVVMAAVLSFVGLAKPASAQYYGGYYQPRVYRVMPVYPPRPVYPPIYRPVPTFPRPVPPVGRWGRPAGPATGMPGRPGVQPSCRGSRNNGMCYGGSRPGVR